MPKKIELNDSDTLCPLRYVLGMIGGKWKLAILCQLLSGEPKRYGEIKKKLTGITNMMLAQSLKELEAGGLVHRKQYNEIPPKVEYRISEAGKSLYPILHLLAHWGVEHMTANTEKTMFCVECLDGKIQEHDDSLIEYAFRGVESGKVAEKTGLPLNAG